MAIARSLDWIEESKDDETSKYFVIRLRKRAYTFYRFSAGTYKLCINIINLYIILF